MTSTTTVDAGGEVSSPAAKPFSVSTFRSKTSGKPGLVSRRACEQKANSDFATSITVVSLRQPDMIDDSLAAVLRSDARRLLAQAIKAEADAFLAAMKGERLPDGRIRRRFRRRSWWNACEGASASSGTATARSARCRPGLAPRRCSVQSCATVLLARLRRSYPLHLSHSAALVAADAELGWAVADPLPARRLDGRLPGGARGAARQGCPEPVAIGDCAAAGRVGSGLRALATARPVGPSVCLRLGRRRLLANAHGAAGRMHAGADRRHTGRQEGTARFPGGRSWSRFRQRSCWNTSGGMRESAQSWRPATGRSAFGRRWTRYHRRPGINAVQCTGPPTCSTRCPDPPSPQSKLACARSGRRPTVRRPKQRS